MADRFYWLIEAPGPAYLTAEHRRFFWTADPNLAIQFGTEKQADAAMMAIRELDPPLFEHMKHLPKPTRAIEHGWIDRPPADTSKEPR